MLSDLTHSVCCFCLWNSCSCCKWWRWAVKRWAQKRWCTQGCFVVLLECSLGCKHACITDKSMCAPVPPCCAPASTLTWGHTTCGVKAVFPTFFLFTILLILCAIFWYISTSGNNEDAWVQAGWEAGLSTEPRAHKYCGVHAECIHMHVCVGTLGNHCLALQLANVSGVTTQSQIKCFSSLLLTAKFL